MTSTAARNLNNLNSDATEKKAYIPIPEAFAGRSIFITGGTGFLGKVLVEKLLRSCPDVKHIYLLMRPKRGKEVSERLTALVNDAIFDSLRKQNPKQLMKIIPIEGDIAAPELGISKSNQTRLCEDVSVVFHSAATVRFNESLKSAITINMLGTRSVIQLCQRMQSLSALIHVSTTYINAHTPDDLEEIVYDPPHNPDDIIALSNSFPDAIIDEMTPSLLDKRPNTYTFTKSLAEYMVLKEAENLPADIVRPAVVGAALKEPTPGWIDNYNAATGIVVHISKGLLHSMYMSPESIADLVPVDIVINCLIAAAWRRMTTKTEKLQVYNICSNQRNATTWGEFTESMLQAARKYPAEDCFWYPYFTPRTNRLFNRLAGQTLPLDFISLLNGRWTRISKLKNVLQLYISTIDYFTSRQWHFKDANVIGLMSSLNTEDREAFMFDVTCISWNDYFVDYVLGLRRYLYKQNPESLPASQKRMTRLYYLHQLTKLLVVLIMVGLVYILFKATL